MPQYDFECHECETRFTLTRRMSESSDPFECPKCGGPTHRVFYPVPDIWHTEGSHRGDYGSGNHTGTKNDSFRKAYKQAYGEEAPDPKVYAPDVPRNSSEKY